MAFVCFFDSMFISKNKKQKKQKKQNYEEWDKRQCSSDFFCFCFVFQRFLVFVFFLQLLMAVVLLLSYLQVCEVSFFDSLEMTEFPEKVHSPRLLSLSYFLGSVIFLCLILTISEFAEFGFQAFQFACLLCAVWKV